MSTFLLSYLATFSIFYLDVSGTQRNRPFCVPIGIEAIMAGEVNCRIFSLDGKPLNEPKKGINIVRMSYGQVRKIVLK